MDKKYYEIIGEETEVAVLVNDKCEVTLDVKALFGHAGEPLELTDEQADKLAYVLVNRKWLRDTDVMPEEG